MTNLAGVSLKGKRCAALPSVAGPEIGMGATNQGIRLKSENHKIGKNKAAPLIFCSETPKPARRLTAGLRIAPPVGRRLGLGPSLALSRRLLEEERNRRAIAGLSHRPTLSLGHSGCKGKGATACARLAGS